MKKITISGPPGSGKSTVARLLAKRLRVPLYSAGAIFRERAQRAGLSLEEFGRRAEEDESIDRALDDALSRLLRAKESGVFEGRLVGWLASTQNLPALKVYLDAPLDVRVERIRRRERSDDPQAVRQAVLDRERSEAKRYRTIYGVDVRDTSFYDLVIDTSRLAPDEVVERILAASPSPPSSERAS